MSGAHPVGAGYDGECVMNLIEHGPIYLGKELLAASFALGAAALIGAFRVDRRSVTWSAATLLMSPYVLIGYPLAFWRRGGEPIQDAYLVGLVVIVGAARSPGAGIDGPSWCSRSCTSRRGSACWRGTRSGRATSSGEGI
jgi:peptidoglycan/LPS O-acetylase OafA/YrhL